MLIFLLFIEYAPTQIVHPQSMVQLVDNIVVGKDELKFGKQQFTRDKKKTSTNESFQTEAEAISSNKISLSCWSISNFLDNEVLLNTVVRKAACLVDSTI